MEHNSANNMTKSFTVRNASPDEYSDIGKLMVDAYSNLDGFPKEASQPMYYKMLRNVGDLTQRPKTEILVAVSPEGKVVGAVVVGG